MALPCKKERRCIIQGDEKEQAKQLYKILLDKISDFTRIDEYKAFAKKIDVFNFSNNVKEVVKQARPHYTYYASAGDWQKEFGREVKSGGGNGIQVKIAKNTTRWLYDISETKGKSLPKLYQNISGKVKYFQNILECLMGFSPLKVRLGGNYDSGVALDSIVQDNEIVLRTGLSEQQIIFALMREIVSCNQTNDLVVQAVSYMVCRHLEIDTSQYSIGYLLELMDYDTSLTALTNSETEETILKEAEVLIGHINTHLDFTKIDEGGAVVEPEQETKEETIIVSDSTQTVDGIDFRFIKLIRDFQDTMPDKNITAKVLKDNGYYDIEMLPMGHGVAVKLYSKGLDIYKLYKNSNEEKIDDKAEFDKHYGLFGIAVKDWREFQYRQLKNGADTAKMRMTKFSEIVNGTYVGGVNIDEGLTLGENGNIVFDENDVSYGELEDATWLDTALPLFFTQTGYKYIDVPYFENLKDFEITKDMIKINALITNYCIYHISEALKNSKTKSDNTGKMVYNVKQAVTIIVSNYDEEHISKVLYAKRSEIVAPKPVVKAFEDYFEKTFAKQKGNIKKPTPDEQLRKHKAADNIKKAEKEDTNSSSDKILEILHIIEDYKKRTAVKSHKAPQLLTPPKTTQIR